MRYADEMRDDAVYELPLYEWLMFQDGDAHDDVPDGYCVLPQDVF